MTTQELAKKAKNNMILPPSIISKNILCELPNDYGAYRYKFTDTKHPAEAPYHGIKKDKLPEDGGEIYWSSSTNEEFLRLVQGDEPRFILEILKVVPFDEYAALQLKEYQMLKQFPDIKTNSNVYNLSCGIPPYSNTDNTIVSDEFLEWFHAMKDSGIWTSKIKEKVSDLANLNTVQIRSADNAKFIKELIDELLENGKNTSKMNPVLIFEGVGEKFGFKKGSDVIVGTRHGLEAAKKVKSLDMHTTRVPYEVLKDKEEFFLRSLASNDNFDDSPIKNVSSVEDGAKELVGYYNATGAEPSSDEAKSHLDRIYGFKTTKKNLTVKQAETDIEMQKLANSKWKRYTDKELSNIEQVNSNDNEIHMCMSSGMFQMHYIYKRFKDDPKQRKDMIVWVYHKETANEKRWMKEISGWEKLLKYINPDKFNIQFRTLASIVPDTEDYTK